VTLGLYRVPHLEPSKCLQIPTSLPIVQNIASRMRIRDILLLSSAATSTFGAPQAPERLPLPHPQIPFEAAEQLPSKTNEKFLVELSPGETRWITEDEKWALRRVSN
jgi:hypothetical protein